MQQTQDTGGVQSMNPEFLCEKCGRDDLKSLGGRTNHLRVCNGIYKPTKTRISLVIRDAVWCRNGNVFACLCPICTTTKITRSNFECGHVIAESCGGETTVNNLHSICGPCNNSMGTTNMSDFANSVWKGRPYPHWLF